MEFLNFNSVELLPNAKASAAFSADSGSVFREQNDIAPVVIDDRLSYMPWGADNQMPYEILNLIESDETLSTCQIFNAEVCYGSGLVYNTDKASASTKEQVEDFFLDNNMANYFLGVCQDFKHFGFCVSVIILNAEGDKVVRLIRKEACYCRFSPANKHGVIEKVLYANWRESISSLIDSMETIRDNAIEALLPFLIKREGWRDTEQGHFFQGTLFPNIDLTTLCGYSSHRWKQYLGLRHRTQQLEEQLAAEYISQEQMQALREMNLQGTASFIQTHIICSLQNVIVDLLTDTKCATRHAPHRLLPDIVEKMRSREDEFPQWHSSHVAKLFSPPIFENKKENNGYWF